MMDKPRLFLDTSALFAGIWSAQGGGRLLLRLGEAGAVQLIVSSQVLQELEAVIHRKASQHMPTLALLLDRSRVKVVQPAPVMFWSFARHSCLIQRCASGRCKG
jgi:predicted nucleic acid-binding protein